MSDIEISSFAPKFSVKMQFLNIMLSLKKSKFSWPMKIVPEYALLKIKVEFSKSILRRSVPMQTPPFLKQEQFY